MLNEAYREPLSPVLRPHQVEKLKTEAAELTAMLSAPPHIAAGIENRGQVRRHLDSVQRDLHMQSPKKYEGGMLDVAVKRSKELKDQILLGMPTQEEMRKNPSSAVDKHMLWEHRQKSNLMEWKNIQLRLHESEALGSVHNARNVANFEKYRPTGGAQELNMDNVQIQGKDYHLPPPGVAPGVVFTEERSDALRDIDPELHSKLSVLDNYQRAAVKDIVDAYLLASKEGRTLLPVEPEVETLTPRQIAVREATGKRMKAYHEKKRKEKALAAQNVSEE